MVWGAGVCKKARAEIGFIPFKTSQAWEKSPWQRPTKRQNIKKMLKVNSFCH